jgi:hypothetical protein
MLPAARLLAAAVLLALLLLLTAPARPAEARRLLQWSGPAYADAGRGTFAYSGISGMVGSPSVIRPPGFFVSGFGPRWGWGRRL